MRNLARIVDFIEYYHIIIIIIIYTTTTMLHTLLSLSYGERDKIDKMIKWAKNTTLR